MAGGVSVGGGSAPVPPPGSRGAPRTPAICFSATKGEGGQAPSPFVAKRKQVQEPPGSWWGVQGGKAPLPAPHPFATPTCARAAVSISPLSFMIVARLKPRSNIRFE